MESFAITTDMTADMPEGYFADEKIDIAPMPFVLDGVDYCGENLPTYHEFYDKLRAGAVPSTSQTSAFETAKIFEKHLKEGKDVLHISFSSGMSGSFDNVSNAAKELMRKYRNRRVLVLDSLSGCGGEGLMVYYAVKMRAAGKSITEIYDWLFARRMNFNHFFIVEDLGTLYRSGRLSKLEAAVGTILGIKPLLELNHSGKIMPLLKVMGKKKALTCIAEQVEKYCKPEENDFILVEHGDDIEGAKVLAAKITELLPDIPIRFCNVNYLVGSHAGPGALAVFFCGGERPRFINMPAKLTK